MSYDKIKKLIEAGITKEDIERELAKRAQAPKKKIIKKIEPYPQDITVEVKTIKPDTIPDKKDDEFVQFLKNQEASKNKAKSEYGDKDYIPEEDNTDPDPELEKWNRKFKIKFDYFIDNKKGSVALQLI